MPTFESVHWLPAPTPALSSSVKNQEVFKSFDDCYVSTVPTDDARPGNSDTAVTKDLPKPAGWKFRDSNARLVVWCSDCKKPASVVLRTLELALFEVD